MAVLGLDDVSEIPPYTVLSDAVVMEVCDRLMESHPGYVDELVETCHQL